MPYNSCCAVLCLQVSEMVGDFPLVHPAMYGKQTRYTYMAVTDTQDEAAQFKVGAGVAFSGVVWCSDLVGRLPTSTSRS